jgi:16S rRNA U516 pseudouridylate synthase RsuA-like enzyme
MLPAMAATPIDNDARAQQLARAIASDIQLYNKQKIEEALINDNFFEALSEEITEGRDLFRGRVTPGAVSPQLLRPCHRRPRDQADGEPQDADLVSSPRVALGPEALGLRLDAALVAALVREGQRCSRSQLARAFAAGQVRVGGAPAGKPGRLVDAALDVEVELDLPQPMQAVAEALPLVVVHEDADLLVIDKPAGMVVHAGPGHETGTLVNAVLHYLGISAGEMPVLPGNDATRPGIVHRLDRDTSGLIVVARNERAQEGLAAQFRVHDLRRRYLGVVWGVPPFTKKS